MPAADGALGRLPQTIGVRYRPLRVFKTGGMSVIYEVEHVHTGDRMALKVLRRSGVVLDDAALARFRREARVCSLVKSEHIVRVFDAGIARELDGAPYLVMDLLDGNDLAELSGRVPQSPARVTRWLQQAARGVEKAHSVGIVHRDLKPENLFWARRHDGGSLLIVLDFGVAKLTQDSDIEVTHAGAVLGTPLYMSPEQAAGDSARVGPPSDVWALGLVAYRLLTGNSYWSASALPALLAEIASRPLIAPSLQGAAFGERFDAWFLRSCARDPAHRFRDVREQVDALGVALDVAGEHGERVNEVSSPRIVDVDVDVEPLAHDLPGEVVPPRSRTLSSVQSLAASGLLVLSLASARRRLSAMALIGSATILAAWVWFSLAVSGASRSAAALAPVTLALAKPSELSNTVAAEVSVPLEPARSEVPVPATSAAPVPKSPQPRLSLGPTSRRDASSAVTPAAAQPVLPPPGLEPAAPVSTRLAPVTPMLDPLEDPR